MTRDEPLFGTVEYFVARHHAGIARIIRRELGAAYDHRRDGSPDQQRLWVLNNETLYRWAVREGVREV